MVGSEAALLMLATVTGKFMITRQVLTSLLFVLPFISLGQPKKFNSFEIEQISNSDSFLISNITKVRFERYFRIKSIYGYSRIGTSKTFGYLVSDKRITHIVTSYFINIPEICLESQIDVIYDKVRNVRYLEDSSNIPRFILEKDELDLLDTSAIIKIALQKGIPRRSINLKYCFYSDSFKKFIWAINEIVEPFDLYANRMTVNGYRFDAITGKTLMIYRNILIDYTPKNHWFWNSTIPVNQRFSSEAELGSIISVKHIRRVQIIMKSKNYFLTKEQLRTFKNNLESSKSIGGLYIDPERYKVIFYYGLFKTLNKKEEIFLSNNQIHFYLGIDINKKPFQGTFNLPVNFNLEKLVNLK